MTTLESPDQLAAALDERGDVLSCQAASAIREQHLALEAACQMEQASAKRIGELVGLLGEAREVVRREVNAFRPFPGYLLSASGSAARIEQSAQIKADFAARAFLSKLNEALK